MTVTTPASLVGLEGTYTVDPVHSSIGFVARHAMVTKVRGTFDDFEAQAVIGADLSASSVSVTIQAASIDTRNSQRDEHLRSSDFLSAPDFPQITFVSTQVRATGDNEVEITGDLTIKGVTRSVTVPFEFEGAAVDPFGNQRIGFAGSTTINRSDFGVTFNAALETGGVLVSEKIVLEFEISAIKSA